jgi:hypothetical protein
MKKIFTQSADRKLIGLVLTLLGLASVMLLGLAAASPVRSTPSIEILGLSPTPLAFTVSPTPQLEQLIATLPVLIPSETSTPTRPPTATLTPSPTPIQGVIWSKEAAVVYLREAPNGRVIVLLPNGMGLRLLDEKVDKAGLTWQKVVVYFPNSNPSGWVAEKLILSQDLLPTDHQAAIQAEPGAYLRAEPGGRSLAFLWNGTLLQALETREEGGVRWVHILVPDGSEGWVAEDFIGPWGGKLR